MEKEKKIEAKNIAYFQALANSRASLTQLQIALIMIWIPAMTTYAFSQYQNDNNSEASLMLNICNIFLFCFIVIAIFSMLKKLVFRFQTISTSILVLLILIITCFLDGIGFLLATSKNNILVPEPFLLDTYSKLVFYLIPIVVICSIIVNVFLLKQRLKIGFSETRTNKNFLAVSGVCSSKKIGIFFCMVMLVPPILTQGKYLMNMFGVLCILGISIIFPSPIVEFSYLAYLKSKSKIYWEKAPLRKIKTSAEKIKLKKRIILISYLVLSFLSVYLVGGVFFNVLPSLVTVCVVLLILISYVLLIITWLARKIDDKKKLIKKRKMKHKRKLMNKGKRKEK